MRARRWTRASWMLLCLLIAFGVGPEASADSLRGTLEENYRVSEIAGGVELTAKAPKLGISSIAVTGAEIRVNGAKVTETVLRAWIEKGADPILRLAELSPREQRQLFGFGTEDLVEVEAPPAPAQSPAPHALPLPPQAPEAPPAPEAVEAPAAESGATRTGSQFNIFDEVVVHEGTSARDVVAVIGDVRVEGEVRGDVTAVLGSVWVEGKVGGEIVAVNGTVHLGPNAEVAQGITAVGGGIDRDPGAKVYGSTTQVPIGVPWPSSPWRRGLNRPFGESFFQPFALFMSLFWRLSFFVFVAFVLAITLLLAPRAVERAAERIRAGWWQAGLAGLLLLLLFVPLLAVAIVMLAITLIGIALIPIVVLVVPFLVLAVCLVGYTAASLSLGRWLTRRMAWSFQSPYAHLLLGLGALELLRFGGGLIAALGGIAVFVGWPILLLGAVVRWAAAAVGIGGVVLARYGHYLAPPSAPTAGTGPAAT